MRWHTLRRKLRDGARTLLSFGVITGLLTGCIATIAPPVPLIVAGSGKAYAPAMAMAADGTKHIVWQECPQVGGCVIYYYRTKLGEPLVTQSFTPQAGADNTNPDIALAADGMAYIVWTQFYSSTSPSNADAYAVLNADGSLAATSSVDPGAGQLGHISAMRPRVVARANKVFAMYSLALTLFSGAGGTHYRELKPLDAISGTVALDSGGFGFGSTVVVSPTVAVDQNSKLHVAYQLISCGFGGCSDTVYQADNTAADDMSSISLTMPYNYSIFEPSPVTVPDIAVADNNSVFVTYGVSNTTDSVIYATGTTAASPFVTATVPFNGALDPWRVEGNAHVAAVNNVPYVAFAAMNNSTGGSHEVWLFRGALNPLQITSGNGDQYEPLIAAMGAPSGEAAVVGWRTWDQILACLRDGYEWDEANSIVQRVYGSSGGCLSKGQALAANENWASAVWIDWKQNMRLVPWLGYNANTTMLPLINR